MRSIIHKMWGLFQFQSEITRHLWVLKIYTHKDIQISVILSYKLLNHPLILTASQSTVKYSMIHL